MFYDSQRLYVELGADNNKNQLLYCGNLAYMFIRLLTNKANEAIRPYLLENIVGFFDTLVDYFHPKSNMSVKKKYAQKMFSKFVGMYVKELKNKNIDEDLKKQLKDALDPVFWKMMNFALFDNEWQEVEPSYTVLCKLDGIGVLRQGVLPGKGLEEASVRFGVRRVQEGQHFKDPRLPLVGCGKLSGGVSEHLLDCAQDHQRVRQRSEPGDRAGGKH